MSFLVWMLNESVLHSSQPPADPSPVILNVNWASSSSIRYIGKDSDSWVMTWADDDELYIAYGDGFGFAPKLNYKVSMGYGKVSGSPTNFTGTNISSPDEQFGDSKTGKKPASMLMVDGVLYLWVRNADNNGKECQIAWSTDDGANWSWSDWTFSEFGYCVFINYGKNYANARDNYVYMVSHDHPHAYIYADDFILTRVPKDKIRDRNAYEFFVSRNGDGSANWSSNINNRGVLFTHSGNARRSSITYNAGIGRYLWWQNLAPPNSEVDIRTEGGFAIFDAPEPWGPWTTAYYTEQWDVGPGEIGAFPSKWMSGDGKTIYLVSSTDDAFAVRRADLTIASGQPTATPTSAPTNTPQNTPTHTATPIHTATHTGTPAPLPTATASSTQTAVATNTPTALASATSTGTPLPSVTPVSATTPSVTPSPLATATAPTVSPTATEFATPAATATAVQTPTPKAVEQELPYVQYLPFVLK